MILIDNITFLRENDFQLYKIVKILEEPMRSKNITTLPAKNGQLTLKFEPHDVPSFYIHSQYNPDNEAESILRGYPNIEEYDHVLFYGMGLGYHIELFAKRYPDKKVTIYEPKPAIFYQFLCNRKLADLQVKKLDRIYLEITPEQMDQYITQIFEQSNKNFLVIFHPAYERQFVQHAQVFKQRLKNIILQQKNNFEAHVGFEKLWTINSLLNFRHVINTPNAFDLKRSLKGMPVILAAAGPSLKDDLEHIKYIQDHKLAYVFAVGSANKVFINNGLLPDAVCSYDPATFNVEVLREIIDREIKTIPLLFGSSVGSSTLEQYPGPKLHMITSQDAISRYYLGEQVLNEYVEDSPTIVGVMLDFLSKMEVGTVYLAGQNLALRGEQYYSKDISFTFRDENLTENEKKRVTTTLSVTGETIYTLDEFQMMRMNIEYMIQKHGLIVVNTTREGADIQGTTYKTIDQVIEEDFKGSTVDLTWAKNLSVREYKVIDALSKMDELDRSHEDCEELLIEMIKNFIKINTLVENKQPRNLEKLFGLFEKQVNQLQKNLYYLLLIKPMMRSTHTILAGASNEIAHIRDPIAKARKVLEVHGSYTYQCKHLCDSLWPYVRQVQDQMRGQFQELISRQ